MAELDGHPMFVHSVRVAIEAKNVDKVVVSSNSSEILATARAYGAEAMDRPYELCLPEVPNFRVLQDLLARLRALGDAPEMILLLQPTTPFRTPGPIDQAIEMMRARPEADSLVTVSRITRASGRISGGIWKSNANLVSRVRNDEPAFAVTGHMFILRPQKTIDVNTLLGQVTIAIDLPEQWLDIDVDTPNEMLIAQSVAKYYFSRDSSDE